MPFQLTECRLFYLHPFNQCTIWLFNRTNIFSQCSGKCREVLCFRKYCTKLFQNSVKIVWAIMTNFDAVTSKH